MCLIVEGAVVLAMGRYLGAVLLKTVEKRCQNL